MTPDALPERRRLSGERTRRAWAFVGEELRIDQGAFTLAASYSPAGSTAIVALTVRARGPAIVPFIAISTSFFRPLG